MKFDNSKIEFDFDKIPGMQDVRETSRTRNTAVIFLYPFAERKEDVSGFLRFKVESNAFPNLVDYGVCKYKCGRMWYHGVYFLTGQTERGKQMREKITSGKIKVGRKAKASKAAKAK